MPEAAAYHIIPYLSVTPAREFIDFCKRAFGFAEKICMTMPGSDKLMHAQLTLGGHVIMLSDEFPMPGAPRTPKSLGGTSVTIHLQVPDVDAVFKQAVAAGATAVMPPTDMFWGDRYGKVIDPFGHHWSIATPKETLSAEEVQKRGDEAMKNWKPPTS